MKIKNQVDVQFTGTLTLSEKEMRALAAMTGYSFKTFMEVFKKHLGSHYMNGYEKDLGSLFSAIQTQVVPQLATIDMARNLLEDVK